MRRLTFTLIYKLIKLNMKKILSLLTLLLCIASGAWAGDVYKLQLNGANVEYVNDVKTSGDMTFFSYNSGKHSFNNKFNGCTYDGVVYTKGLKMESATNVSWTSTLTSTVIIVQSTWSDHTIKFDGNELSIADAEAITGGRIYTITNVEAGDHSVTRGSGESGIFAITVEYADAVSDPVFSLTKSTISIEETSQIQVGTKGNLDGITMSNLTYDADVILIDENGLITPKAVGTSLITFESSKVEGKYNAGSAELSITITPPLVATPVISPNDGTSFSNSITVTATCETEGAALTYSIDGGENWATMPIEGIAITETTTIIVKAAKAGRVTSQATATFTKIILDNSVAISESTTWDWSKYGTKEIKTEGTEFYRQDILVKNVAKYGFADAADAFGPSQSLILNGDFIVRDTKYCQVTHAKFTTTVPGTISVEFSNTGGNRPYRYLYVNGQQTAFKSNESSNNTTATGIFVEPGEVDIYGVVDPESEDAGAGGVNFLRIYKIIFTSVTSTNVTVSDKLYRTFTSKYPLDFTNGVTGLTAYKANVDNDEVTFTEVTGKVPAGEGLLLKATEANTYTIPVSTTTPDAIDNAFIGVTSETVVEGAGIYVLYDGEEGIGFYKTSAESFTVGANTAYLPAEVSARDFIGFENETTGIKQVEDSSMHVESFYNLAGQRVAQPNKGLYIVNGKKVVVK